MIGLLLTTLTISLVLNLIFFLIAYNLQTDKFTDITYSLSFIVIAAYIFARSNHLAFETIGALLILVWALRLGGFLLYRIIKKGKDRRFDGSREKFLSFGKFWLGQAIVAWVLTLPAVLAFSGTKVFSWASLFGIMVWAIGLVIEATADIQKFKFRMDLANKDKWIDSGLWRYSRHPNYFGEILIWLGIYLYALPALDSLNKLLALISPLFIILTLRYVSGIPILEKSADRKWGHDSKYVKYKGETNLLIPIF